MHANIEKDKIAAQCDTSETLRHYVRVSQLSDYTYVKHRVAWKDSVCTRLKMGYKYLWELGVEVNEAARQCRLCGEPDAHSPGGYIQATFSGVGG